ncbi:class I mannose-6-phosphate isomerase [Paenibacillus athensensis]|uniref:class I mannose-6-phosphate isomerase n=1 Tax=Paenibacillus athensensis TaxID=1967502 RepID=UPI001ADDDF92|nr:class I mannose-6-phosphate isomerase [Paenibacillus athensensis]MCD1259898.1 class I mannose-6-phosphate isomerase [Paenibacillus athensensis]
MTAAWSKLAEMPIALSANRVWRTYRGGSLIDRWQGMPEAHDSDFPEEWVASVVQASNAGREHIHEGISRVKGSESSLLEIIGSDPERFLGQAHVRAYGQTTAVLVKLLDAGERLTLQVHPDREFARAHFHSEFGKTEAWYIVGTRSIAGEEPYVLMGFKPGMTAERWKELFEKQDIAGMLASLHRLPVRPGDVYLVEGGMPHAIGAGCFMIEIQEPTDLTLRTERTTPRGVEVPDRACHQGLGFDEMLACFHYECYTLEELRDRFVLQPQLLMEAEGGNAFALIERDQTDRFRMHRLRIGRRLSYPTGGSFAIAIVMTGRGQVVWPGGTQKVAQGDTFFIPAALAELTWVCQEEASRLEVVYCLPPSPGPQP